MLRPRRLGGSASLLLAGPSTASSPLMPSKRICRRCLSRATSQPRKALQPSCISKSQPPRIKHFSRFFSWSADTPANKPLPPQLHPSTHLPTLASSPFLFLSPLSAIPDTLTQLLLSTPLPAGYSIILLTLLLRTSITLPLTQWQRARVHRTRTLVLPEMKRLNPILATSLVHECRARGDTYEAYQANLKSRLAEAQAKLHRKHKTHPLPTLLVPLGVHIPLLITLSVSIRRCVEMEGGWGNEGFLWLNQMGEVDPLGILPVLGGVVAFANAEIVGRKTRKAEEELAVDGVAPSGEDPQLDVGVEGKQRGSEREIPGRVQGSDKGKTQAGQSPQRPLPKTLRPPSARNLSTSPTSLALPRPRPAHRPPSSKSIPSSSSPPPPPSYPTPPRPPRKTGQLPTAEHLTPIVDPESISAGKRKSELRSTLMNNMMKVGAVLFIPIAAQVPGALALYWTTSMVYTLMQNVVFNWVDANEAKKEVPQAET